MAEDIGEGRPSGPNMAIRPARQSDRSSMMAVATSVDLFGPDELAELGVTIDAFLDGTAGTDDHWIVGEVDGAPIALAYFAPERMTVGTWNLYLIAVRPDHQGRGHGAALLRHVEHALKSRGERILLIETAGLESFAPQRRFYERRGYEAEACIREFYAEGTDKIVFRKAL